VLVSVLNWIRKFGQKAAELRSEPTVGVCQNEIFVAEIDDRPAAQRKLN